VTEAQTNPEQSYTKNQQKSTKIYTTASQPNRLTAAKL
jgi:hypothetical protein